MENSQQNPLSSPSSLRVLGLFEGIGGFAIASHRLGFVTTQFVEIDPFCQKVLAKNFPGVPIHDDISTFTATPGQFDLFTAGFPCSDISLANANGQGLAGKRSGLFFRVCDLICKLQPKFIVLENVPALLTARDGTDMGVVLRELSSLGFDAEWITLSASSLGAPHRRNRVFIVAYPQGFLQGRDRVHQAGAKQTFIGGDSWWRSHPHPEPSVSRVGHGLSPGLDSSRVKALGNAVTPQQAAIPLLRVKQLSAFNEKNNSLCASH